MRAPWCTAPPCHYFWCTPLTNSFASDLSNLVSSFLMHQFIICFSRKRLGLHQLSDLGYHHINSQLQKHLFSSSLPGAAGRLWAGGQPGVRGGEGTLAWGSAHLSTWDLDAHWQSFHFNAAALPHSSRYRIGDLSYFIPSTVLDSRVIKRAERAVMLAAACSSIWKSQIGLLFLSASIYYLRCMTKLFLRKLLYSTDFFLPPSII